MRENVDIMKYVFNNAQHDISTQVMAQCKTGRVYKTVFPSPEMIKRIYRRQKQKDR